MKYVTEQNNLSEVLTSHSEWIGTRFSSQMSGSRADFSRANLSRVNLSEADLRWANFSRAKLSGADLSRADLSGANLSEANLRWANFFEANLSRANLSRADFSRANLSRADLRWADLSRANLSEANLSRANLSEANLRWAKGEMKFVKSMQVSTYEIVWWLDKVAIGCQVETLDAWINFDPRKLSEKDRLEFKKLAPLVLPLIRACPPEVNQASEGF